MVSLSMVRYHGPRERSFYEICKEWQLAQRVACVIKKYLPGGAKHEKETRMHCFAQKERAAAEAVFVSPYRLIRRLGAEISSVSLPRWFLLVMSEDWRLYVVEEKRGVYNHASILKKKPVKFAGEIRLDKEGRVVAINNASGHYLPDRMQSVYFLLCLHRMGVSLEGIRFTIRSKVSDFPHQKQICNEEYILRQNTPGEPFSMHSHE